MCTGLHRTSIEEPERLLILFSQIAIFAMHEMPMGLSETSLLAVVCFEESKMV